MISPIVEEPIATNSYGFRVRILGNEVFSIELISSDGSNRWVALGLVSIFSLMVTIGAFGDKFIALYHTLLP